MVSEAKTKSPQLFSCDKCDSKLESKGLLLSHKQSHTNNKSHSCDDCDSQFTNQSELEKHVMQNHKKNNSFQDWNCNDCLYQGHTSPSLLKHLKTTGHQPSALVEKRSLFPDYKECYTCNEQFDGYTYLMEHRKAVHPSNKKCQNLPN